MLNQEEPKENITEQTMESKELQRLRPFNQPGATEDSAVTTGARQRHLSLSAARANFDIAMDNMLEEMDHIEDRNRGAVVGPQLRKEYVEMKHSEKKLFSCYKHVIVGPFQCVPSKYKISCRYRG